MQPSSLVASPTLAALLSFVHERTVSETESAASNEGSGASTRPEEDPTAAPAADTYDLSLGVRVNEPVLVQFSADAQLVVDVAKSRLDSLVWKVRSEARADADGVEAQVEEDYAGMKVKKESSPLGKGRSFHFMGNGHNEFHVTLLPLTETSVLMLRLYGNPEIFKGHWKSWSKIQESLEAI